VHQLVNKKTLILWSCIHCGRTHVPLNVLYMCNSTVVCVDTYGLAAQWVTDAMNHSVDT